MVENLKWDVFPEINGVLHNTCRNSFINTIDNIETIPNIDVEATINLFKSSGAECDCTILSKFASIWLLE